MPQKKNPDPLELIRGKAGRLVGRQTGWLTTMKGLPSGYNKDLQEDKEAVFEAEVTLGGSLASAATVVEGLALDSARTRVRASGMLLATDVAEYLVARGVPFREAHEQTGTIVRTLVESGTDFAELTLEDWRAFNPLFDADIAAAVTPESAVKSRKTPQSTNPDAVAAALEDAAGWLAAFEGVDEDLHKPGV